MEPMTGIEPAYSAWEADVLPLNYIGEQGFCRDLAIRTLQAATVAEPHTGVFAPSVACWL